MSDRAEIWMLGILTAFGIWKCVLLRKQLKELEKPHLTVVR